ncbi:hypothetical protein [Coleofasciculus sp. FACHB-501]|uniref:hypothetical protein n=1 Tax=Cyanophyceae TaxID=3028117 RepID=UPI0016824E98|nr:hypothetical protein [Coleofasciculus sp. FACHB-501]MBD1838885.1 hypothetical protein [Coleofasciculus sp. FACHB-501]
MAQQRPIKFTQILGVAQFKQMERAAYILGVLISQITRTALDKYLSELDSLTHKIRTPAA